MQLQRIAVVEMSVVHKLSPHLGACSKECYFLVLRTMMECMTLAIDILGISQVYHTGRGAACKVILAKYQARINFTATQEMQRKGTGGAAGNRF